MTVPLESLFWRTHLDLESLSIFDTAKLLLWLPIGITFLITRLLGTVAIISLLSVLSLLNPSYVLPVWLRKLLLLFIGVSIQLEGVENLKILKASSTSFIVATNHRTAFDILPFTEFTPFSVMLDGGFFNGHALSRWFLKAVKHYMEPIQVEHYHGTAEAAKAAQRDRIASELKRSGKPLFYFPEGWDTNGKGLLRYQKFLFGLQLPVLPVALAVSVPFVPIRPGMLGSSIFREILWLLFSPCYCYHLCILPAEEHNGQTDTEFASRTQQLTAAKLGIPATDWSKNDALTYRRSLLKMKAS